MTSSQHPYIGRFAPSPTGPLHLGSLLAAVGSYLQARHQGGQWLVRMENLDPPREAPGAADDILRTLESFTLYWDGPVTYQSQRSSAYDEAIHQLEKNHQLYPCQCSRKQIAAIARRGVNGMIYPDTCRNHPISRREPHALRMLTDDQPMVFDDLLRGPVQQRLHSEVGDFVVKRLDGLYAYQLAVVVDDAAQHITEVVRGNDLLNLTPGQIYLQRSLGLPTPRYLHLPILVDESGAKLSKQNLATPVDRHQPSPALLRVLELLGQQPPAELSDASVEETLQWAITNWRPDHLPRASELPLI